MQPLPPAEYDGAWKDALELGMDLFLSWALADIHAAINWQEDHEFLDQELQKLAPQASDGVRRVDKLVKAVKHDGDALYLHLEAQMQPDDAFGSRLQTYRRRLRERLGVPVVSIAILGDDNPSWRPTGHEEGQFGSTDKCTFRTVKLIDWADKLAELEASANVFCLFVAAHLEALASRQDAEARRVAKVRLLRNLLARPLDPNDGQRWYRLIQWVLRLPDEMDDQVDNEVQATQPEGSMTYISYAERKGIAMGRVEGMRSSLRKIMGARFGADGVALVDQLDEQADSTRLESLIDAALGDKSLDELRPLFNGPASPPGANPP